MRKYNGRKRSSLLLFVRGILLTVFLFSGYLLCSYLYEFYQLKNTQRAMADIYEESVMEKSEGEELEFTLEYLKEINEDIVGWIAIDGTSIDYPVVQAGDNDYYLTHSIYKEDSSAGAIFMDFRNCPSPLGEHTVVYGHHMRNGTMFRDLISYKEKEFYKEHPYVVYSGEDGVMRWEVFSAYVTDASDDYIETDFSNGDDFGKFLEEAVKNSLYDTGCKVKRTDKILTLSTCSYEFENARMVVHAKLIE